MVFSLSIDYVLLCFVVSGIEIMTETEKVVTGIDLGLGQKVDLVIDQDLAPVQDQRGNNYNTYSSMCI